MSKQDMDDGRELFRQFMQQAHDRDVEPEALLSVGCNMLVSVAVFEGVPLEDVVSFVITTYIGYTTAPDSAHTH